jgi:hypothetical protein
VTFFEMNFPASAVFQGSAGSGKRKFRFPQSVMPLVFADMHKCAMDRGKQDFC